MNYKQSLVTLFDRIRSSKAASWLIKLLEAQLVVTTLSLPLILAWGLPVSLITIAGNSIFAPFLLCFLLLSSLIFVTQLLCIPNMLLITALEYFQRFWLALTAHVNHNVLLELPAPPLYAAVIFMALALALICYRIKKAFVRCALLFFFLIISCAGLHFFGRPDHAHLSFKRGVGTLHFLLAEKKLICVDDGIGSRAGLKSWMLYTVLPTVRKIFGTTKLHALVFLKPTPASLPITQLLLDAPSTQTRSRAPEEHADTQTNTHARAHADIHSRAHACALILPDACTCPTGKHPAQKSSATKAAAAFEELAAWAHVNYRSTHMLEGAYLNTQARTPTDTHSHSLTPAQTSIPEKNICPHLPISRSLEVRAEGTMQRTKDFAHALLGVRGTCGQEKITLVPVLNAAQKTRQTSSIHS